MAMSAPHPISVTRPFDTSAAAARMCMQDEINVGMWTQDTHTRRDVQQAEVLV